MGHRLSKIYTRTGDDGSTGLGSGDRVPKDSVRVDTYGAVDETNSLIGLVLASDDLPRDIEDCLTRIQHQLFDLGGELSMPGTTVITAASVAGLERTLDDFNADLPPLKDFILPGGTLEAATCHVARTVCRRAERRICTLAREEDDVNEDSVRYLNRLSDLLFVIARVLNRRAGTAEPLWKHRQ
ncbi:MAG: cob(I)yrinic acid a,c-diamide adenosyltransferase [Gammaproteobacteria bacterium]